MIISEAGVTFKTLNGSCFEALFSMLGPHTGSQTELSNLSSSPGIHIYPNICY